MGCCGDSAAQDVSSAEACHSLSVQADEYRCVIVAIDAAFL
jgi:hypothetical protein